MHEYKPYKNPQTGEVFSACCKCGDIEVKNAIEWMDTCSEKMHPNCNVKALGLIEVEQLYDPPNTKKVIYEDLLRNVFIFNVKLRYGKPLLTEDERTLFENLDQKKWTLVVGWAKKPQTMEKVKAFIFGKNLKKCLRKKTYNRLGIHENDKGVYVFATGKVTEKEHANLVQLLVINKQYKKTNN